MSRSTRNIERIDLSTATTRTTRPTRASTRAAIRATVHHSLLILSFISSESCGNASDDNKDDTPELTSIKPQAEPDTSGPQVEEDDGDTSSVTRYADLIFVDSSIPPPAPEERAATPAKPFWNARTVKACVTTAAAVVIRFGVWNLLG